MFCISKQRAVEPIRDSIDPYGAGRNNNSTSNTNTGHSRRSPTPTGRRSPFSRRDYTGNPVANTGRL